MLVKFSLFFNLYAPSSLIAVLKNVFLCQIKANESVRVRCARFSYKQTISVRFSVYLNTVFLRTCYICL